jgi:hypothetical protein
MSSKTTPSSESFKAWQQRVRGTNISETTLLATDYLNHFNEIIMSLGMVPDMPEILDDCRAWQPKTYKDHFRDSSVADRELAIEAYDHVPTQYREPFERTIARLDSLVGEVIETLDDAVANGSPQLVQVKAKAGVEALQRLADMASAVIHGSAGALTQEQIDKLVRG